MKNLVDEDKEQRVFKLVMPKFQKRFVSVLRKIVLRNRSLLRVFVFQKGFTKVAVTSLIFTISPAMA